MTISVNCGEDFVEVRGALRILDWFHHVLGSHDATGGHGEYAALEAGGSGDGELAAVDRRLNP